MIISSESGQVIQFEVDRREANLPYEWGKVFTLSGVASETLDIDVVLLH
jgi:hypothetical protein